jgi:histidyl-tRNA synthetase
MTTIQPVKGTRDFYPEKMAFRKWLYDQIRLVSESFGYQEYEAPFLERIDLYAAKSGEELVKEQSFVFPDRSGELIALRPELTPSLARMVAMRSRSLPRPIRWWSFGPFWRYERPQRGRTREFFQWNIDLLGVESPQADAELAAVIASFFRNVGLGPDKIVIKFNNRRLADAQLLDSSIPADQRATVFRLIDRKEKMSFDDWKSYASDLGLSEEQFASLSHNLNDMEAFNQSDELLQFSAACEAMGITDYLEYDPTVIRGLDYYTGTVFEARDRTGGERALLGGGRYDNLVAAVGGDPVSGVGFAMGDVVIQLILEKFDVLPDLATNPAEILVPTFDETCMKDALALASELRLSGFNVEWFPEAARISKQFKYADRQGIPLAVVLGPDEIEQNSVAIKNLKSREQSVVPRGELVQRLKEMLEQENSS